MSKGGWLVLTLYSALIGLYNKAHTCVCVYLRVISPAEQTDSDKGGETQPQRLRETDAPPDEANEISGGRTLVLYRCIP